MQPAAPSPTSAAAPQSGDPFVNVTPPGLAASGAGEAQAVAAFAGSLFVGVVSCDPAARVDLRRILRFDGSGWTTPHRSSVALEGRGETGLAAGTESAADEARAAAAVLPGPGAGELIVRLSSPLATHALVSSDGVGFLPIAATAAEVFEAFSLGQAARSTRHHYGVSWFAGHPRLRRAPAHGSWAAGKELALPRRADGGEMSVGGLAVFGDRLVAGMNDAERGFELFVLTDEEPPAWQSQIARGGQRFSPNAAVLATAAWNDALYLVAGRAGGRAPELPWLPGGFELIRVYPDFTWDVIIGTPRVTDSGLKVPLAGLGPGLDDFNPAEFRCLAANGGELLLGTYEDVAGFRVWSSTDGERWSAVSHLDLSGQGNVRSAKFHATAAGAILELNVEDPARGRMISLWLRREG